MNPATDYAMSSDNSDDDEDICYELPSAREAQFEQISFESASYETSYKKPEHKLKKQKPKKRLVFDSDPTIKTLEIIRP